MHHVRTYVCVRVLTPYVCDPDPFTGLNLRRDLVRDGTRLSRNFASTLALQIPSNLEGR